MLNSQLDPLTLYKMIEYKKWKENAFFHYILAAQDQDGGGN